MGGNFCDVEQGDDNENLDGLGRGRRRMRAGAIATIRPGIAPNTAPARAPVYGCPWHSSGPPPRLQSKKRQPEKNPKISRDSSRVLWSEAVASEYFLIPQAVSSPGPARGAGPAVRIAMGDPAVETGDLGGGWAPPCVSPRSSTSGSANDRAATERRRRGILSGWDTAPRPVHEDRWSGTRRGRSGEVRNRRGQCRNSRIPSDDGLLRAPSCNST